MGYTNKLANIISSIKQQETLEIEALKKKYSQNRNLLNQQYHSQTFTRPEQTTHNADIFFVIGAVLGLGLGVVIEGTGGFFHILAIIVYAVFFGAVGNAIGGSMDKSALQTAEAAYNRAVQDNERKYQQKCKELSVKEQNEIKKIMAEKENMIQKHRTAYNNEVNTFVKQFEGSESTHKLLVSLYGWTKEAYQKANKAEYVKKINLKVEFHVTKQHLTAKIFEDTNLSVSRSLAFEHALIRPLEFETQVEALAKVLSTQLKAKMAELSPVAIISSSCILDSGTVSCSIPNDNVSQYTGW